MAEKLDPIKETVTIAGLTIANMWEAAAILELLEERGILTKQDVYDKIQELRRTNPGKIQPDEENIVAYQHELVKLRMCKFCTSIPC